MKIAIIFYSFSGNTRKVCQFLSDRLVARNHDVEMIDVSVSKEVTSFAGQCKQAFFHKMPELGDVSVEVKPFEALIFASPVWAFTFAPALRTYLGKIDTMEGIKVGNVVTYGSGLGSAKTLREMRKLVQKKKGEPIFLKRISDKEVGNSNFLEKEFNDVLISL